MNAKPLLLVLPLIALASCGDNAPSPTEYFDSFEVSAKKGLQNDYLGMTTSNGKVDTHFISIDEEGTETEFGLGLNPLAFDLRIGGVHAQTVDGLSVSFFGSTTKKSRVFITGFELPSIIAGSDGGVALDPHFYFDQGTFYLDFADAAIIPVALKQIDSRFSSLPIRGFVTLDEEAKNSINEYMPLDEYFPEAVKSLKDEFVSAYSSAPSAFAFSQEGSVKTIKYAPTSWEQIRAIADGFINRAESSSSIDQQEYSSFFDELQGETDINRFVVALSYDTDGLTKLSLDVSLHFREKDHGDEKFYPTGDMTFSGDLAFTYGEAAKPSKLTDREKSRYTEIVIEK